VGEAILQVSIAVFWGTVEILFGQRWLSSSRKSWPVHLWAELQWWQSSSVHIITLRY